MPKKQRKTAKKWNGLANGLAMGLQKVYKKVRYKYPLCTFF
jgi:hypothetical protein